MNRIAQQLERRRFRSIHKSNVRKWYADHGESKLCYEYPLCSDSIVLDLGGYEGQWASNIFARYQCYVYVFEPVLRFAEQISDRFRNNGKIDVYPFGIGGSSRTEQIHLAADGSSLWGSSENVEAIKIVDVAEWMAEKCFDRIDLMKINIEGGEYELLDRLIEKGYVERIENLQIQFHNICENSRSEMERIQSMLQQTHVPTYQYDFVWENWTIR